MSFGQNTIPSAIQPITSLASILEKSKTDPSKQQSKAWGCLPKKDLFQTSNFSLPTESIEPPLLFRRVEAAACRPGEFFMPPETAWTRCFNFEETSEGLSSNVSKNARLAFDHTDRSHRAADDSLRVNLCILSLFSKTNLSKLRCANEAKRTSVEG